MTQTIDDLLQRQPYYTEPLMKKHGFHDSRLTGKITQDDGRHSKISLDGVCNSRRV